MQIIRLACTQNQVADMELIGGPPKKRTWKHPDHGPRPFHGEAVEVEAIDAPILRDLISNAIEQHIDPMTLRAHRVAEESERKGLLALANGWKS
jgi:hypothetical protein